MSIDSQNVGGIGGPAPFEHLPSSAETYTIGHVTKDDMEKSGEELVLLALSAMFPQLMTPSSEGKAAISLQAMSDLNQKCVQYMLDRWSQDAKQIAQDSEKKAQQDQVMQTQINQQRINDIVNLVTPQVAAATLGPKVAPITPQDTVGAANAIDPTTGQQTNVGQMAFQTSLLVSMALSMGGASAIGAASQTSSLQNILGTVFQAAPITTIDTTGAQALMASLFGPSIYYGAMREFISTIKENANLQQYPAQFAKGLTEKTLAFINNPAFSTFVLATAPRALNPLEVPKFLSLAKLSFLLSALAAGYKAETGGGTASEVWAMAQGKMNLPATDPRHPLINAIQVALSALTEEEKNKLEARFNEIKLDHLMDEITLLQELGFSKNFRAKQLPEDAV